MAAGEEVCIAQLSQQAFLATEKEPGGGQFVGVVKPLGADLRARRVRVHQDRKAAACRPVDRPLRTRRHPYRRMRLLHWFGQYLDILKMEMLAGESELRLGPSFEHDLHRLMKAR